MGKTMREYVAFSKAIEQTPRELSAWMKKALDYAGALPPKASAARRGSAATTARKRTPGRPARRRNLEQVK